MLRSRENTQGEKKAQKPQIFGKPRIREPKLRIIDMSPEAMPKRNSISIRLTKAVSIYLATSFYDNKCIASDEHAIGFRSEIVGEALLRLRSVAEVADLEFMENMDVTKHAHVSKLRWMLQRNADELDVSKIPKAMVKVEINGLPELGDEGDLLPGRLYLNEVSRSTVEFVWIEDGGRHHATLVPGKEEFLGDMLVKVLEINID